jgi:hypothetical protein
MSYPYTSGKSKWKGFPNASNSFRCILKEICGEKMKQSVNLNLGNKIDAGSIYILGVEEFG